MNTKHLIEIRDQCQIKKNKINRILEDADVLKKNIEDLHYLKRHAGEMIFTGNSGKIGERDVMLKTIKINTLAGCVVVPDLLLSLAGKRLTEIKQIANEIIEREKP